jgi:hypothetical protein
MERDPLEVLERVRLVARTRSDDPKATLASIAEHALGPLSDAGVRQLCAALADVVAHHPSGVLLHANQRGVAEQFMQRLAAHGVLVLEAGR